MKKIDYLVGAAGILSAAALLSVAAPVLAEEESNAEDPVVITEASEPDLTLEEEFIPSTDGEPTALEEEFIPSTDGEPTALEDEASDEPMDVDEDVIIFNTVDEYQETLSETPILPTVIVMEEGGGPSEEVYKPVALLNLSDVAPELEVLADYYNMDDESVDAAIANIQELVGEDYIVKHDLGVSENGSYTRTNLRPLPEGINLIAYVLRNPEEMQDVMVYLVDEEAEEELESWRMLVDKDATQIYIGQIPYTEFLYNDYVPALDVYWYDIVDAEVYVPMRCLDEEEWSESKLLVTFVDPDTSAIISSAWIDAQPALQDYYDAYWDYGQDYIDYNQNLYDLVASAVPQGYEIVLIDGVEFNFQTYWTQNGLFAYIRKAAVVSPAVTETVAVDTDTDIVNTSAATGIVTSAAWLVFSSLAALGLGIEKKRRGK